MPKVTTTTRLVKLVMCSSYKLYVAVFTHMGKHINQSFIGWILQIKR